MQKSEIKVGNFYDVEDRRLHWGLVRAEVIGEAGPGSWKIRLLDPPYAGHERTVTSRQITRNWLPPATRLRNGSVRVAGGQEKQGHHDRLTALTADLCEELEMLEPTHPVEVGHIALPSSLARNGAPGSISITLSEPAAQALLESLRASEACAPDALRELI